MRKLECESCGGQLELRVNADGQAIGTCTHCAGSYLIDKQRNQTIVLEHRIAGAKPASVGRRAVLAGAGAVSVALLGGLLMPVPRSRAAKPVTPSCGNARLIYDVGGIGAALGQFREKPWELASDVSGRTVVRDGNRNLYTFSAEGVALAQFPPPLPHARFVTMLVNGKIILGDHDGTFHRVDPETGKVTASVEAPPSRIGRGMTLSGVALKDGSFATYRLDEPDGHGSQRGSLPGADMLLIFDRNGALRTQLDGLMAQALADDPMVQAPPRAVGFAMDGAGNIFVCLMRKDDHDTRGGIYEFNADGTFQRKIAIDQKYFGDIAASPDGTLFYCDPWMEEIQRIRNGTVDRLPLSVLGDGLGLPRRICVHWNGDIGMTTSADRLIRFAWDGPSC